MDYLISLVIFIGSYLIGSLSFARIFLFFKKSNKKIEDLEINIKNSEDNSKNVFGAGAGSASMILGTKYGIIIGILDILKALVPIFLILHFYFPNEYYHLIFSLGVLIGHNWPIYFRFKGGRGISVIFGIKNDKSRIQTIRFDRKLWTVARAREWLKRHGYKSSIEAASGKVKKGFWEGKI